MYSYITRCIFLLRLLYFMQSGGGGGAPVSAERQPVAPDDPTELPSLPPKVSLHH